MEIPEMCKKEIEAYLEKMRIYELPTAEELAKYPGELELEKLGKIYGVEVYLPKAEYKYSVK
jgi:hypothetical protein